mmetsp:Transcript_143128/g.274959  ORF Transcript_143128/g.274959 Transcript_143128/m.274959 type:complete len:435 (-) Transcript_143128:130-1434(-)
MLLNWHDRRVKLLCTGWSFVLCIMLHLFFFPDFSLFSLEQRKSQAAPSTESPPAGPSTERPSAADTNTADMNFKTQGGQVPLSVADEVEPVSAVAETEAPETAELPREDVDLVPTPTGDFEADFLARVDRFEERCTRHDKDDPFIGLWSEEDARSLCKGTLLISYFFNSKPEFQKVSGWGTQQRASTGGTPIAKLDEPGRFKFIQKWYDSVKSQDLCATIFHDSPNEEWYRTEKGTEKIRFVKVEPTIYDRVFSRSFGLNDVRYFFVHQAICANLAWQYAYYSDIFDVVVARSPIGEAQQGVIYAGLDNDYMKSPWLEETFQDLGGEYHSYWKSKLRQKKKKMWSSGLMGGDRDTFLKFLARYAAVFSDPTIKMIQKGARTPRSSWGFQNVNMPALNYVIEKFFPGDKNHGGSPFNSEYRRYENDRKDVWFIHK